MSAKKEDHSPFQHKTREGMRILVIAMTRMGDLFQMAPMVASLRERHKGCRIALVAYREFGEAAAGLALFDELYLVDALALRKMIFDDTVSFRDKIRKVKEMSAEWSGGAVDLLINLTPNRIGAVLGYLVGAREVRGVTLTRDGFRAFLDPAIAYFGQMVQNRLYNDTNLVDLFLRVGQVPPPQRLVLEEKMGAQDSGLLPEGRTWIAVQTGASVEIKRWPEHAFVRMIAHLLSREPDWGVVLIGAGAEEVSRNRRIVAALEDRWSAGRILNLTGQTSVSDLAGVLRRVARLVSNDTGVMHVAAAMGTPVVALSFANLYYHETAPYGEGHVAIQSRRPCAPCGLDAVCLNPLCRQEIDPEWVARLVAALGVGERSGLGGEGSEERLKAQRESLLSFLSENSPGPQILVARSEFDGRHRLLYRPLTRYPMGVEDLFRALYRQIWSMESGALVDWEGQRRILLEDFDPSGLPRSAWEAVRLQTLELGGMFREGESLCFSISQALSEGEIGESGKEALSRTASSLEELDQKIREKGWVAPPLGPVTTLFGIEKEAVAIDDPLRLLEMVESIGKVYRQGVLRVDRLIRLADRWFSENASPVEKREQDVKSKGLRPMAERALHG